jgi:hypothetical protein
MKSQGRSFKKDNLANKSLTSRELPDLVIKRQMDVKELLEKHRTSMKTGITLET